MDENGELGRISQEEDGRVVEDPVVVALLSVELDSEATRVPRGVWGSLLSANSREPNERPRLLSDLREEVRRCELRNVVGDLELPESTGALRVNNTAEASGSTHGKTDACNLPLWYPLAVEVCQEIDQVEILQQQGTVLADTLGGVRVHDGTAIAGGIYGNVVLGHDCRFLLHCLPGRVECISAAGWRGGAEEAMRGGEKVIYGKPSSRFTR